MEALFLVIVWVIDHLPAADSTIWPALGWALVGHLFYLVWVQPILTRLDNITAILNGRHAS